MNDDLYITMQEAAKIAGVTQQALYQASWRKALKTKKVLGRTHTTRAWLKEYNDDLYSRQKHSIFNGEKTFNPEKGEYSFKQAAALLGVCQYQLYWRFKIGKFKAIRRGYLWVITADQLQIAQETFMEKTA